MTTRSLNASGRALAVACLVALAAVGCATTVPRSDSTPPTVSMTVGGLGSTVTVTPTSGDQNRTTAPGPNVVMLASASDPEGVKTVSISGAMTIRCSGGDLGQAVSVHYVANNPEAAGVGPGDEALDQRLTSLEIDTAALANFCGEGFTFSGASGGFQARGENFHGGVTTTALFGLTVN